MEFPCVLGKPSSILLRTNHMALIHQSGLQHQVFQIREDGIQLSTQSYLVPSEKPHDVVPAFHDHSKRCLSPSGPLSFLSASYKVSCYD